MTTKKQTAMFLVEVHAPTTGTEQNLNRALVGGTTPLQNTGVAGNRVGGTTRPAEVPPSAMAAGQQKFSGRGSTGWSALTLAVKILGLTVTTQEFLIKLLKWQADVGRESKNTRYLKPRRWKRQNFGYLLGW